jgi:leucyl aminopeptidase (aminopeptidase T)
MEPPDKVANAVLEADLWIEFAVQYLLYTEARFRATAAGCRYACLSGMTSEMCIRTIGQVDQFKVIEMGNILVALFKEAKSIRVTSELGTDISATMSGEAHQSGGFGEAPGSLVMLSGQACHLPLVETIDGEIVADGVIWPPDDIGILQNQVRLTVRAGKIIDVQGRWEAERYSNWLESFQDPALYQLAHYCYGFNPGVEKPSGRIVEDERVFGALTFGFGSTPERNAASHTDCVILTPSVELDDILLMKNGIFMHPQVTNLCQELKVAGY